jgi:hypothetical protein
MCVLVWLLLLFSHPLLSHITLITLLLDT